MSATAKGQITEWPQTLVWALFNTTDGAAKALNGLQNTSEPNLSGLISVENTAVVEKDASGQVTFSEREDLSGWQGLRNGLLIGGLIGALSPEAAFFSTAAKTAAQLAFGGRLHDAGFEDNELRAAAEQMPPSSSAFLVLITHQWLDDFLRYLNRAAYVVGSVAVSQKVGELLEQRGR